MKQNVSALQNAHPHLSPHSAPLTWLALASRNSCSKKAQVEMAKVTREMRGLVSNLKLSSPGRKESAEDTPEFIECWRHPRAQYRRKWHHSNASWEKGDSTSLSEGERPLRSTLQTLTWLLLLLLLLKIPFLTFKSGIFLKRKLITEI